MDVIRIYIDNVFAAYEQTNEIKRLKQDMSANMEEKYLVLRQDGKSEHEAAYSVIADFGRIDEITDEIIKTDIKIEKEADKKSVPYNKGERLIGTIAAVYWPTAVAIYLTWNFTTGAWATSWIMWPIAGVLFGAISGGLACWFGVKDGEWQ